MSGPNDVIKDWMRDDPLPLSRPSQLELREAALVLEEQRDMLISVLVALVDPDPQRGILTLLALTGNKQTRDGVIRALEIVGLPQGKAFDAWVAKIREWSASDV